ncbi:MAG: AbrB/MazE/SpoVT family DNA-binding domain-containing protein [Armatimonadetes bacterium]|nr:AbrB/MazE/SpoVT family DNA-binding domain-containing protein [Armatimonadota bacterium]
MSKVTSKLQVTVPKAVADQYGIRPGDEVDWVPAGDSVRLIPAGKPRPVLDVDARLKLFDQATERQRRREECVVETGHERKARGWTRDELYDRG